MTHEDDMRGSLNASLTYTRDLLAGQVAERKALLDVEPPELPANAKDEAEFNHAAGEIYRHHERIAALNREIAVHEYQVRSLKRQIAEVAA